MLKKSVSVQYISTKIDNFFYNWLVLMRQYHNLTDKEMAVVACFLKHRYQLQSKVTDADLLDKIIMSEDVRKEVQTECGMPLQYFQVMCSKFRKKGIIKDNKLNPKFIPRLKEGDNNFQLIFLFDFNGTNSTSSVESDGDKSE